MKNLFAGEMLTIPAGRAVSGVVPCAGAIQVVAGRVWLTVEGEQDDYWLSAGESIEVDAGRLVVLEADRSTSRVVFPEPDGGARRCRTPAMRPIRLFNC
jgi:hypothetical protein